MIRPTVNCDCGWQSWAVALEAKIAALAGVEAIAQNRATPIARSAGSTR
jgi:hypothetical protein